MVGEMRLHPLAFAGEEGEGLHEGGLRHLLVLVVVARPHQLEDQLVGSVRAARVYRVGRGVRHVYDRQDSLALDVVADNELQLHRQLAGLRRRDGGGGGHDGRKEREDAECGSCHAISIA